MWIWDGCPHPGPVSPSQTLSFGICVFMATTFVDFGRWRRLTDSGLGWGFFFFPCVDFTVKTSKESAVLLHKMHIP